MTYVAEVRSISAMLRARREGAAQLLVMIARKPLAKKRIDVCITRMILGGNSLLKAF